MWEWVPPGRPTLPDTPWLAQTISRPAWKEDPRFRISSAGIGQDPGRNCVTHSRVVGLLTAVGESALSCMPCGRPAQTPVQPAGKSAAVRSRGRGLHEAALSVLVSSSTCGGEARREEGRER